MKEKIRLFLEFIMEYPEIQQKCMIGGSFALYLKGIVETFSDIDLITEDITPFENLDIPKGELKHPKRLNRSVTYRYKGLKIDILEPIVCKTDLHLFCGMSVCTEDSVLESKRRIGEFIALEYPGTPNKYLNDKA